MDAHTKDPAGYFLNCMDPGGDTGLSLLHIKPDSFRLLECATVPWDPRKGLNPTATLVNWRLEYPGVHHFVYEGFHIRNTESAAATDPTALLVIGAVEQVMYDRGHTMYEEIFTQEPVAAKRDKGLATDEKLEKLNLHMDHRDSQRHVRDANRHAVVHLVGRGYLPMCRVAYPRRSVRTRQPALPGSPR
jgi:hypothetical protein